MSNEEKLKEKYIELSVIDAQLKELQQQLERFDEQLIEINSIKASIDELNDVKKGTKAMVSVHQGIFAGAMLENTDEFLVNVGSNVVVKKNAEQTKELLDRQMKELASAREQLLEQFQKLATKAEALQKEALALSD